MFDEKMFVLFDDAAAQIPMMRELKDQSALIESINCGAAAQIPMMRELKVYLKIMKWLPLQRGCSPNPYDEGTERASSSSI